MVKHLFAPWRGDFIRGPKSKECIFCRMQREHKDRSNLIAHRATTCFIVLNRFPYTSGHLMVVPYQHLAQFEKLPGATMAEMMEMAQCAIRALKREYRPRGFNLGMNLGQAAGAGIAGHLHLHVVPRWPGDSNFMATSGDVRVISLSLDEICETLRRHFG